jgi:hypothetical protein
LAKVAAASRRSESGSVSVQFPQDDMIAGV